MTNEQLQAAIDIEVWWRKYTEDNIRLELARPTGYSTRFLSSFWYFNRYAAWERQNHKPYFADVDAMILSYACYFDMPLCREGV